MSSSKTAATKTFAPLPETQRGYGIHINASNKGTFCYGNGKAVVIRDLADPSISSIYTEHKAKVNCCRFSPNGEWVASGDDQGIVRVWGAENHILKNEVRCCARVLDLAWSPDGLRIAAVGDGEVKGKCFSWDSGNNLGKVDQHAKAILAVDYKPTRPFRIVTCSEDLSWSIYEGPPFKFKSSCSDYQRYPNSIRFAPNGDTFITVDSSSNIIQFDAKDGTKIKDFSAEGKHKGSIYSFSWSPCGEHILTASGDKTAKQWNVANGTCTTTWTLGKDVADMQVSTLWSGEYMLSISLSGAIKYLSSDGSVSKTVAGHINAIRSLAVDAAAGALYTSDIDGKVCKWGANDGSSTWFSGKGSNGKPCPVVALTNDNKVIVSASFDDNARFNSVSDVAFADTPCPLGGEPVALVTSPTDATTAVCVLAQEKIVLIKNNTVVATSDLPKKPGSLALHPNGTDVVVGLSNGDLLTFSVDGDALKKGELIKNHRKNVTSIVYSSDGALMASADTERCIFLWDTTVSPYKCKNPSATWTFHGGAIHCMAFSPDNARLASVGADMQLCVWTDLVTGRNKCNKYPHTHAGSTDNVAWLDANTVITTGDEHAVKFFSVK